MQYLVTYTFIGLGLAVFDGSEAGSEALTAGAADILGEKEQGVDRQYPTHQWCWARKGVRGGHQMAGWVICDVAAREVEYTGYQCGAGQDGSGMHIAWGLSLIVAS